MADRHCRRELTFHLTNARVSCYSLDWSRRCHSLRIAIEWCFQSKDSFLEEQTRRTRWSHLEFQTSFTLFIVVITNIFLKILRIIRSRTIERSNDEGTGRWIYFGWTFMKFGNFTRWISRPNWQVTSGVSTVICSSSSSASCCSCPSPSSSPS